MTEIKVFYSWQSDLPNPTNRRFIHDALEAAAKAIRDDDSIDIDPLVERDTQNVPGTPDIVDAIFSKIVDSHVFVGDVSIINRGSKFRPSPNPNVLLELGYAIKVLGWDNILMVMNTDYGMPAKLPFDLLTRRVITYSYPKEEGERSKERKQLQKKLEAHLRAILNAVEEKTYSVESTIQTISTTTPGGGIREARRFMEQIVTQIDDVNPKYTDADTPEDWADEFVDALEKSKEIAEQFTTLVSELATRGFGRAIQEVYGSFGLFIDKFSKSPGFSGYFWEFSFDLFRFLAHEFFVDMISVLIMEGSWEQLNELLSRQLVVKNSRTGIPTTKHFSYLTEKVRVLDYLSQHSNPHRVSVHADILKERYAPNSLGNHVSFKDFMEADYFLLLRSVLDQQRGDNEAFSWHAWSILYMHNQPPSYIIRAVNRSDAENLAIALGIDNISELRELLLHKILPT